VLLLVVAVMLPTGVLVTTKTLKLTHLLSMNLITEVEIILYLVMTQVMDKEERSREMRRNEGGEKRRNEEE